MGIVYSQTAINAKLSEVVTVIGSGGKLQLLAGGTPVSTVTLATPAGTVSGGILTFTGPQTDPSAAGTGTVTTAQITDSLGTLLISGLTVGIPLSGADIIIVNGLNSTFVNVGQKVTFTGGSIVGS
jgi:hypothetical protein